MILIVECSGALLLESGRASPSHRDFGLNNDAVEDQLKGRIDADSRNEFKFTTRTTSLLRSYIGSTFPSSLISVLENVPSTFAFT